MNEIKLKRRTLSERIIYTIGKISKVCHDDGLFQAQRLGLVDSLIDDAETAAHEIETKDAEIERLQGGIGYLLERSGHKPCNRLDLEAIMGRILAGEDVYSYRLKASQDV